MVSRVHTLHGDTLEGVGDKLPPRVVVLGTIWANLSHVSCYSVEQDNVTARTLILMLMPTLAKRTNLRSSSSLDQSRVTTGTIDANPLGG